MERWGLDPRSVAACWLKRASSHGVATDEEELDDTILDEGISEFAEDDGKSECCGFSFRRFNVSFDTWFSEAPVSKINRVGCPSSRASPSLSNKQICPSNSASRLWLNGALQMGVPRDKAPIT